MYLKKIALVAGLVFSGISVSSVFAPAQAVILNVGGKDYDVTRISTNYNESIALLQQQPWWTGTNATPNSLADQFASALLAVNSNPTPPPNELVNIHGTYGPFFLFQPTENCIAQFTTCATTYTANGFPGGADFLAGNINYEYEVLSSTVVPEPLNILGATITLALFGTSSTILKRRKVSK